LREANNEVKFAVDVGRERYLGARSCASSFNERFPAAGGDPYLAGPVAFAWSDLCGAAQGGC
jgi:hypothetical protein